MRALVISDIHSNLEALEAVLASAPRHDLVWNLGDVVGYAANPNEVVERARYLGGIVVRGNHDRVCGALADFDDFGPVAARAVEWTRRFLSEDHREWLQRLPAGPIETDQADVVCVHGSTIDEDEYLVSPDDAFLALRATKARITLFGHTHKQIGFATNGGDWVEPRPLYTTDDEAEDYELPLRPGARYLLNPGSVGQPRDHDWRAAFAIYDDVQALFTWYRVPYDVSKTQESIRRAGLPDFLADRLIEGR